MSGGYSGTRFTRVLVRTVILRTENHGFGPSARVRMALRIGSNRLPRGGTVLLRPVGSGRDAHGTCGPLGGAEVCRGRLSGSTL